MKWEYKVLKIEGNSFWGGLKIDDDNLERQMNELGEQGWDMTRVLPIETNESTTAMAIFFKRQIT